MEIETMMMLEMRKGRNKAGCEIISSRLRGKGGLSRCLPTRAVTWNCSPSSTSFLLRQLCLSSSLLFLPSRQSCGVLAPPGVAGGCSQVHAFRALPGSAWQSVSPTSSEFRSAVGQTANTGFISGTLEVNLTLLCWITLSPSRRNWSGF